MEAPEKFTGVGVHTVIEKNTISPIVIGLNIKKNSVRNVALCLCTHANYILITRMGTGKTMTPKIFKPFVQIAMS